MQGVLVSALVSPGSKSLYFLQSLGSKHAYPHRWLLRLKYLIIGKVHEAQHFYPVMLLKSESWNEETPMMRTRARINILFILCYNYQQQKIPLYRTIIKKHIHLITESFYKHNALNTLIIRYQYLHLFFMGNLNIFESFQEPIVTQAIKEGLVVATLNYCGIAYSPFEFYFKDYENDIATISKIFKHLIPKHIENFDQRTFKWEMGKIDKTFKKGRYSNMFYPDVGIFWHKLINEQQFYQRWEEEFQKNASSFKFAWTEKQKQTVMKYDFTMYHTLLTFVFQTESFEDAIKNSANVFFERISPFYKLSFLDEKAKLVKFMQGFNKLQPDVFFIQEYSTLLLEELRKSSLYVVNDPKEDSLILLNKNSFSRFQDFSIICKEINDEQRKSFKWAESVAFTGADNYIFVCVHLSSQEEKNKVQIQNLKYDLLRLKQYLPKYEIVVGGDLNSFLKPDQEFCKSFHMFPLYDWNFTTLKKRTYAQAQFHKAQKEVKESKDRIISTCNIQYGDVMCLGGGKADEKMYLPSHDHPYDHLLCCARITK